MSDFSKAKNLLRSAAVRAGASALYYSGALSLLSMGQKRAGEKPRTWPFAVLLYHRVNPDNDPFFPAVSVKAFDGQMRYLARHYRVLPLVELIERVQARRRIEPGTIAVTFDDGYKDNYLYAHPILRRYNLPATLFAATGFIGTADIMWNDRIAFAVKHTKRQKIAFPREISEETLPLGSATERLSALDRILEKLKTFPEPEKRNAAEEIFRSLGAQNEKLTPLMLSWEEVRKLSEEGWEIGSHTVNHVILTRVGLAQAREEIGSSSAVLKQNINRPVRVFAYPNGKSNDYNGSIQRILVENGYVGAVTTVDDLNDGSTDRFAIGRSCPWEENVPSFALKLTFKYRREPRLHFQNDQGGMLHENINS